MLVFATALLLGACAPGASAQTGEVRLDGRVEAAEREGGTRHALVGEGEVVGRREADGVYLAVRGPAFGWSHVYIQRGDTLFVLHASAALGAATYVRDGAEGWGLVRPFAWAVRDTTFDAAAEAARAAFFDEHGWLANTNTMGTRRAIEFWLSDNLLGDDGTQMAVVYASDPQAPAYWPEALDDATLDAALIAGQAPGRLRFAPDDWAAIGSLR